MLSSLFWFLCHQNWDLIWTLAGHWQLILRCTLTWKKERTRFNLTDHISIYLILNIFLKKNPISGLFLNYFRSSQTKRSVVVFWWSACPPSTLTIRVHIFMKPIFFSVNVIWNNKQKVAGVDPFLKFTSNKCS